MLINMNLCPDGFYLVYGHAEPPCFLPLPRGWDVNLQAAVARFSLQKVVWEEAGIPSFSRSPWCGCGCVAAAGMLPRSPEWQLQLRGCDGFCRSEDDNAPQRMAEGERTYSDKWAKGRITPGQRLWISKTWLFIWILVLAPCFMCVCMSGPPAGCF